MFCSTSKACCPLNTLLIGMPLTRYATSPVRPPRKWPSLTPACRFIASCRFTTGSASSCSASSTAVVVVRAASMSGRFARTTASCPSTVASPSTASMVVVLSTSTMTFSTVVGA